ncbi:hypothetical protein DL95DRAFT_415856 [Leptodontidium sp. 2 PMI_412]|nr:hypothetical protein DL95DRAFT_415856 [Leptodontidium sp. 2 PMI_412]
MHVVTNIAIKCTPEQTRRNFHTNAFCDSCPLATQHRTTIPNSPYPLHPLLYLLSHLASEYVFSTKRCASHPDLNSEASRVQTRLRGTTTNTPQFNASNVSTTLVPKQLNMDPNLPIGFEPSFGLVVRHIVLRLGILILKITAAGVSVLLKAFWFIGVWFSRLVRMSLLATAFGSFAWPERIWLYLHGSTEITDRGRPGRESENGVRNVGGVNGLPEGWVRYVICRTEEISELDLERCEGCRQVLETEIGVISGEGKSLEALVERQERVESWLREIEKLDRDSGYSSPEADGEVSRQLFWESPD